MIVKNKLKELIQTIFKEETEMECNYLIKSKFWKRYTEQSGCNKGDQWSLPNIDGIVDEIIKLEE